MALAKTVAGATHTPQVITWTTADGQPQDLTGATLTGTISTRGNRDGRAIAGALELLTPALGLFRWIYDEADVVEGFWSVQFIATYGDSTDDVTFAEQWEVTRRQ
jgi:hypothetical protein